MCFCILIRNIIDILIRDVSHERNYLLVVLASGTNPGKQKYQRHAAVTVLEPVHTTAVSVMCRAVPAGSRVSQAWEEQVLFIGGSVPESSYSEEPFGVNMSQHESLFHHL